MGVGGLILLSASHLIFDLFDLLDDRHGGFFWNFYNTTTKGHDLWDFSSPLIFGPRVPSSFVDIAFSMDV